MMFPYNCCPCHLTWWMLQLEKYYKKNLSDWVTADHHVDAAYETVSRAEGVNIQGDLWAANQTDCIALNEEDDCCSCTHLSM